MQCIDFDLDAILYDRYKGFSFYFDQQHDANV